MPNDAPPVPVSEHRAQKRGNQAGKDHGDRRESPSGGEDDVHGEGPDDGRDEGDASEAGTAKGNDNGDNGDESRGKGD